MDAAISTGTTGQFPVTTPEGVVAFVRHTSADVHRYVGRLTGGGRQLTEDIVQEAFYALVRHVTHGGVVAIDPGWIMTTARNRFIDHVRSVERDRRLYDRQQRDAEMSTDEWADPAPAALSSHQATALLAALPEVERWALALQVVDGLSVAEIAAVLGRSVDATTSVLARARRRLRATVEVGDDGD